MDMDVVLQWMTSKYLQHQSRKASFKEALFINEKSSMKTKQRMNLNKINNK